MKAIPQTIPRVFNADADHELLPMLHLGRKIHPIMLISSDESIESSALFFIVAKSKTEAINFGFEELIPDYTKYDLVVHLAPKDQDTRSDLAKLAMMKGKYLLPDHKWRNLL